MRFRPRYSLLALLLLTALVAGGVQFWYRPQQALERPSPNVEVEYTFTRDWRGNKIIHGPHVIRIADGNAHHLDWTEVTYYRQGERLTRAYNSVDVPDKLFLEYSFLFNGVSAIGNPLTDPEKQEFAVAIQQEKQRPIKPDKFRIEHEESFIRRIQHGFTIPGETD